MPRGANRRADELGDAFRNVLNIPLRAPASVHKISQAYPGAPEDAEAWLRSKVALRALRLRGESYSEVQQPDGHPPRFREAPCGVSYP